MGNNWDFRRFDLHCCSPQHTIIHQARNERLWFGSQISLPRGPNWTIPRSFRTMFFKTRDIVSFSCTWLHLVVLVFVFTQSTGGSLELSSLFCTLIEIGHPASNHPSGMLATTLYSAACLFRQVAWFLGLPEIEISWGVNT